MCAHRYTMLNSTMQSSKSGGPVAAAWAVLQVLFLSIYLCIDLSLFHTGEVYR